MINVCSLVSYHFLPAKVGGQKGIALFNKYFSEQVRLICVTTRNNDAAAANYSVYPIVSNSAFRYANPILFFTLRNLFRREKITHLVLEHPYYGWLAMLLKWFGKIKIVLHAHNMEGNRFRTLGKWWWKLLWHYEKWVHQNADVVFFIQDEDKAYAVREFRLDAKKCHTITYGIEWTAPPSPSERKASAEAVKRKHDIPATHKLLLFNGAFDYLPNRNALEKITAVINPLLAQQGGFEYTIVICGRKIPPEIATTQYKNIVFAGFVEDVSLYFKAADVFLNPVTGGGGIKTKLVEALGYNCNAVSTKEGAIGVNEKICNEKLIITGNEDWKIFAEQIVSISGRSADTPSAYFDHFYWGNIAKKASAAIL